MKIQNKELYVDEPIVVSFSIGELGWFLQAHQARLRYLNKEEYPEHKFILMTDMHKHVFVQDFIYLTINLPDWFYALQLERDCFEAPIPGSPPGSLTPPDVYMRLIQYIRQFYNPEKAIELWPPRGYNPYATNQTQLFCKFTAKPVKNDRPIITVFPRFRARAFQRNVPPSVWANVVDNLKETFTVVLAGTPDGACLVDYKDGNVINLIKYDKEDKSDQLIRYLNSSVCSISSQSGGTHISLLSGCPSYIIGHEKERHCEKENRLNVPTTFRFVGNNYQAISAELVLSDVSMFLQNLEQAGYFNDEKNEVEEDIETLNTLMNATMDD